MSKNSNLHQAKRAKNDEFYTQLSDIEKECKHYKQHFNGKVTWLKRTYLYLILYGRRWTWICVSLSW